jgi:hypothetical protein
MLEFILELLGEFLIQIVLEGLVELGFHAIAEPFRKPLNPYLAVLGYVLLGAVLGGVSLLVFPSHIVGTQGLRIMALVIVPLLVGCMMLLMGIWREKRGQPVKRLDRFGYGYVFALSLGLTRYLWAH